MSPGARGASPTEVRVPGVDATLRFGLHDRDDKHISHRIATEGTWEPFETDVVRRLLRGALAAGGSVLFADCGANLGWYSVIAAALGADVVACEPLPANAALLRSNVERNGLGGRIEVHEIALGDRAGTAVLRLSADNQGDHRIQPETKPENAPTAPTVPSTRPGVEVPITTLDAVLRGRRPDVLKLDTQGSEVAILRGGRAAWAPSPGRPDPAIVVELWPYGLRRAGAHESDLLALLGPLIATTHECFEIREWSRSLEPLSSAALAEIVAVGGFSAEMKGFTNLVLVPHRLRPALDGPDGAS